MSLRRRFARREERGLTSFELVVGISVLLLVGAGALSFLESAQRVVKVSTTQTQALDEARTALARLTNEVHGAASVKAATATCPESNCLVVTVLDPATATTVDLRYQYDSVTRTLSRAVGDSLTDVWNNETPVAGNVSNGSNPVFCRSAGCVSGSSNSINIVLDVNVEPKEPAKAVRLTAYVTPRNL